MREGALEFDGDTIIQYPILMALVTTRIRIGLNIKYKNLLIDSK